jgi:hypothetical protein
VRIYEWVWSTLRLESGLFADLITPDGTVDRTIWSYNQGSVIGAGVLLHQATGDATYLAQSRQVAEASLDRFDRPSALATQPPAFVAIYLRNLLLIAQSAPCDDYTTLAEGYAEHLWTRCLDRSTGLIAFRSSSSVNTTAPAIAVEAMLAGSARALNRLRPDTS